jgi:hypothetical protein
MLKLRVLLSIVCILAVFLVSVNCAPGNDRWDPGVTPGSRANFWAGIWHGLIIIVTFVVSLFTNDVGVYEVNNVGWAYNLGFIIGLSFLFGPILKSGGHKRHMSKRDLNKIGDKIEERVRKGIKSWLEEKDKKDEKDKEWEEIATHIERKIKEALQDWKC